MNRESQTDRDEMISVNLEQAKYYDATDGGSVSPVNSFATNLWRKLRMRGISSIPNANRQIIYEIQKNWLGELKDKKVLELGAGAGSFLTAYLVDNCEKYDAIDLSSVQINALRSKIGEREHVRCIQGDFLDCPLLRNDYDVIYAQSVFHHFRYINALFDQIEAVTIPGSQIITLDPLQTWYPARIFRTIFRPFQTDSAWEFPFDGLILKEIQNRFDVADRFGLYGRSKWAVAIGMAFPDVGQHLGRKWFNYDFSTDYVRHNVRSCLMLCCDLRTKGGPPISQVRRL